ncbi:hypothetical protein AHF37_09437 [Paragonimus kellicotti]|nr:hypothetical protein AHF37_09437 [Paragonimus kellicotti]
MAKFSSPTQTWLTFCLKPIILGRRVQGTPIEKTPQLSFNEGGISNEDEIKRPITPPVTKAVFCDDEYLVDNDSSTETKGDSEDEAGEEDLEEEMEGEELAGDLSPSPSQLFTADNLRGMVADVPSRTQPLIQAVVSHLWRARSEASDGSRESSIQLACDNPPDLFRSDWVDPDYLDSDLHVLPNLRFVSRGLLFDLVAEFIQRVYAGEDEEYGRSRAISTYRPRVSSAQFRIWNGPTR